MLGKLSSIPTIVDTLRKHAIDNYGITEFVQGQTRRWAIAWSFGETRIPDHLARYDSTSLQNCMPPPNAARRSFETHESIERLHSIIQSILHDVNAMETVQDHSTSTASPHTSSEEGLTTPVKYTIRAAHDTWSRAARRKRKRDDDCTLQPPVDTVQETQLLALECVVSLARIPVLSPAHKDLLKATEGERRSPAGDVQVHGQRWEIICTWIRGRQRAMFESFWNHISRKIGVAVAA